MSIGREIYEEKPLKSKEEIERETVIKSNTFIKPQPEPEAASASPSEPEPAPAPAKPAYVEPEPEEDPVELDDDNRFFYSDRG